MRPWLCNRLRSAHHAAVEFEDRLNLPGHFSDWLWATALRFALESHRAMYPGTRFEIRGERVVMVL